MFPNDVELINAYSQGYDQFYQALKNKFREPLKNQTFGGKPYKNKVVPENAGLHIDEQRGSQHQRLQSDRLSLPLSYSESEKHDTSLAFDRRCSWIYLALILLTSISILLISV